MKYSGNLKSRYLYVFELFSGQFQLADRRMANTMDTVPSDHTTQERQPTKVPELLHDQPSQQSHVESTIE